MRISTNVLLTCIGVIFIFNSLTTPVSSAQVKRGSFVGFVTEDATNKPLSGVTVSVVGTNSGAITDSNGRFALLKIPDQTSSLRFSLVGFQELEITSLTPKTNDTLRVKLRSSAVSIARRYDTVQCKKVIEQAIQDTTNATFVYLQSGGFVNPDTTMQRKIATITRKYGYATAYSGCADDCRDEYNTIIHAWLDKRNPKGWQDIESKELDTLWKSKK